MDGFTKNHVQVRTLSDGRLELGLSPEGGSMLGPPLRFQFRPGGASVARGEVFGRVDGEKQSFRLHAPFSMVIESVGAESVHCLRSSTEGDTLLAREAYLSLLETGIPR